MLATTFDRPITDPSDDRLGLKDFADDLARTLIADDGRSSRGIVIGLEGAWGSGKSSVLNLVAACLRARAESTVLVRFDPWLVSNRDDLIAAFLRELENAIDPNRRNQGLVNEAVSTIAEYGRMLSPAANLVIPGSGTVLRSGIEVLSKAIAPSGGLTEMRSKVETVLAELDRPVVVLIDELDRIENAEVRTVAQLVRSVLDFKGISYLLAYDPKRVAEALGGGQSGRGEAYLEKIVQQRVPLPAQVPAALRSLLNAEFRALMADSTAIDHSQGWDCWLPTLLDAAIPNVITNLRDMRRSLASFAVLEPMLRFEVDPVDLLGWSMLQAKSPEVVRRLNADLSTVCGPVLSGGEDFLRLYLETPRQLRIPDDIFTSWEGVPGRALAELLLLRPEIDGLSRTAWLHGNSIAHRDTLLTVLTYGTHTPRFPVADVLTAVAQGYNGFQDAAVGAWTAGTFPQFLSALRIAYPQLQWSARQELFRWLVDLAEQDAVFGPNHGARRRHRWTAMSFVFILLHNQIDPMGIMQDLFDRVHDGRTVLVSHVLALGFERRDSNTSRPELHPFSHDQIEKLATQYLAWVQERAKEGALVRSLRDYNQVRMLREGGGSQGDFQELCTQILSEIDDQTVLDHLVDLFYGDETVTDDNLALYVNDSNAVLDKLILRAQDFEEVGRPDSLDRAIDAVKIYINL